MNQKKKKKNGQSVTEEIEGWDWLRYFMRWWWFWEERTGGTTRRTTRLIKIERMNKVICCGKECFRDLLKVEERLKGNWWCSLMFGFQIMMFFEEFKGMIKEGQCIWSTQIEEEYLFVVWVIEYVKAYLLWTWKELPLCIIGKKRLWGMMKFFVFLSVLISFFLFFLWESWVFDI